jgi:hypothetical protein
MLKSNASILLEIKDYLKNDGAFQCFLEAVIKRRLIVGKNHFSDLGLDEYLLKIKLNETVFYNILSER